MTQKKEDSSLLKTAFTTAACGLVGGVLAGPLGFIGGIALGGYLTYNREYHHASVAGAVTGAMSALIIMATLFLTFGYRSIPEDTVAEPAPLHPAPVIR